MGNWQKWLSKWARSWSISDKLNPINYPIKWTTLYCVQILEEDALEQKHPDEVETDRSNGAHECDGEGDAEVEFARVDIAGCKVFHPLVLFYTSVSGYSLNSAVMN